MSLTFGSLFAGIGGFDLGFDRAGMVCKWRVEPDVACCLILRREWPCDPIYGTVQEFVRLDASPVDVICGGDPCPQHSHARSNGPAVHPDLSGWFLAVVGRYGPRWVVRENVPSPTADQFSAALEALGYGTVVIRLDGAEITGQSRPRDFVVGCYQATGASVRRVFSDADDGLGTRQTNLGTRPLAPCLTTHRTRYDSRDCCVWEHASGLRILDGEEREALAGFPKGWASGLSESARARVCGNAVIPAKAEWIGRRIVECHDGSNTPAS